MEQPELRVEGATEHNLRDVEAAFSAGVTAVVGVSGSGKSSLVFDTVYHEARRRTCSQIASRAGAAGEWAGVVPRARTA